MRALSAKAFLAGSALDPWLRLGLSPETGLR